VLRILILNAGWSNKGTYALTKSMMEILRTYIPDVEFVLMGVELNQDKLLIKKQLAFKPFKNLGPWVYLLEAVFINICMRCGLEIPINKTSPLYEYINCDMVLNSGGDHLSGEFNKFGLSSYMNILYAILLGKPVVLCGESLGYYTNPVFNFIATQILNNVDLILVREFLSKMYLDKNCTNLNVYVTADPAFMLKSANVSEIEAIFSTEGIDIKRPLIGINPSGLINKYTKNRDIDLNKIMARLADKLTKELDATILLIPHVYTFDVDDRKAIHNVFELAQNKQNIQMIQNEYTAEELKGVIGMCDLFIGTRMHATIASTSMLVPTIGIAYSHKMHGIIGEMLKQKDYIINVDEIDYETLETIVYDAWRNKDKINEVLSSTIPIIRDQSMLNGKYIKLFLDAECKQLR